MRVACLRKFGEDLRIEERADPEPAPGEVLVRVRAVGLCGTDLKVLSGALPGLELPLVPGHEVAGEVVTGAGDLAKGQRVACYIFDPCGDCTYCERGEQSQCPRTTRLGLERDGGLATYVRMRPENLIPFGEGITFAEAAVAMDAVASPWRALVGRGDLQPGEAAVVVGAGGLGLHAVQIAVSRGARVAVVDPVQERRKRALEFGATAGFHPDDHGALLDWAEGGADLALEASGSPDGFRTAAGSLRPLGRLVCCGYWPGQDYAIDSAALALREYALIGSRGSTRAQAAQALAAVESGAVRPMIAGTAPLAEVNRLLDALRSGEVSGRVVVTM